MSTKQISLQQRILIFFTILLTAVILLVVLVTLKAGFNHSSEQLADRLNTASNVLIYKLSNDARFLQAALENAAKDFNTKQLIASAQDDQKSLASAITNQQRRANAQISAVISNDAQVLWQSKTNLPWPNPDTIHKQPLSFMIDNNSLYLLSAAPVKFLERQNTPDAWILMGVDISTLIGEKIRQLTDADLLVFYNGHIIAQQTLNNTASQNDLKKIQNFEKNTLIPITLSNNNYLSYSTTIIEPLHVTLLIDRSTAHLNFKSFALQLAIVVIVIAVMALVLTHFISRGIASPLRHLTQLAEKIRRGEYQTQLPEKGSREIQQLAQAFDAMQSGIQKREMAIQDLAYNDPLTKLPNRNAFMKAINERINLHPQSSFAVLLMNLDRFKEVNDTIGHNMGDKLLQLVAERILTLNLGGSFHAHVGGDEFAIMLTELDQFDVQSLIEQYSRSFDLPFKLEGIHLDVDASIGAACYPCHADSQLRLMQCADIALNRCKNSHQKWLIYQDDFNTMSLQRLNLMSELRLAIDTNQLQLFYQPKFNYQQDQVLDVECLIRWVHPEHGFVMPDDFIPLAEQSGAIRDLTHWVIDHALQQYKACLASNIKLRFAVNISAIDLIDLSLPSYLIEKFSEYQVEPDCLTIEITESAVMSEADKAITALSMLKRMGIKLSIDDFGTGYSSMAQLKKMPVDELKIDKSFVMELPGNSDDEIIVKSTVDLAHNLGLTVVAEGVETEACLDQLKRFKVDYAQGYFIAKPLPEAQLISWMKEQHQWRVSTTMQVIK